MTDESDEFQHTIHQAVSEYVVSGRVEADVAVDQLEMLTEYARTLVDEEDDCESI
jgi:hypothetical protein